MNDAVLNAVQVSPSEKISFRCTGCSACCRHVRQSVVLESLDVFRITKYLRDRDSNIKSTDDFLEKHAEIALLDECGFFVFMLKVQDADDACVFLKENRCMIHSVKPRACRIYPFIASPTENGRFEYLVSKEQTHHFKGPNVSVSRWMNQYFLPDEREALHTRVLVNQVETEHELALARKLAGYLHCPVAAGALQKENVICLC